MSAYAAELPGLLRNTAVARAIRSATWLPALAAVLLLVAIFALGAAGMGGRVAPPPPKAIPSDGPPPRMASVALALPAG
jgi:hypothetical protein